MNPKVSVIVAAFNQELFIGRCLRSLLHQSLSLSDYEIIVVNDGSTDKTSYSLTQFMDPNSTALRVINNQINLGLPASLNKGIKQAKGEFIVRVDSDDFVNYNFLSFLYNYLLLNPKSDAVACDYILVDDSESVIEHISSLDKPIACGIMFRRHQLFDIGLYDAQFLRHEERELRHRFEKKYSIEHLKIPLYRYRRHQNNITNDIREMQLHEERLVEKYGSNV